MNMMNEKIGLILEGGGMRGVYTAGVLDFFLDKNIEFGSCYGVSAGSVNASNYLSKQRGRTYRINVDYIDDRSYASFYNLLTTGNFFGTEMCYDIVPNELNPYDYDTFNKYEGDFYVVATNCRTGKPEYFKMKDLKKEIDVIRASCSLPLMAEMVKIGKDMYLDGGIADSVPIRRSVCDGHEKNVIILTRDLNYRKKPNEFMALIKVRYAGYPNLVKALERRHIEYNRTLEYIENQEKKGKVYVIRPSKPIKVGKIERDKDKLTALYHRGLKDAGKEYDKLLAFLGGQ